LLGAANDTTLESKSLLGSANQVISYLPIWGKNKEVLGAIEIRRSVESYRAEIRRGVIFFALMLGTALLALFSCVYFLVAKGAKRLAKTQQVLSWLATTDPLTGLYNRREIMARASESFSKEKNNKRHKTPDNLGLLMLDFDNFKEINDRYGHPVGDQVLQDLARRLRSTLRPYDILGRIGGEEFLVVLPDSQLKQCQEIAERLRKTVREKPFECEGLQIFGSISIGGATAHPLDRDLDTLLKRADERLYQAKTCGKDCVSWAEEAIFNSHISGQTNPC
jgi:diguanylate cyclase (GGDEF)-like protein